jgi:hypothetical protein
MSVTIIFIITADTLAMMYLVKGDVFAQNVCTLLIIVSVVILSFLGGTIEEKTHASIH